MLITIMFRLITEHVYTAGMSELVKEDCSALAFILGTAVILCLCFTPVPGSLNKKGERRPIEFPF
jgi:hypothetical protein